MGMSGTRLHLLRAENLALQQRRHDAEYAVGSCEFPVITEINKRKKDNFLKGGEDF